MFRWPATARTGSRTMADNLETIIALEWLAAAQGVDFHRPLEAAAPLAESVRRLRA